LGSKRREALMLVLLAHRALNSAQAQEARVLESHAVDQAADQGQEANLRSLLPKGHRPRAARPDADLCFV
jgi:hypothetical protein